VRAVVVVLDVGSQLGAGLLERLELGAPDEPFLELAEPLSMNAWDSGSR